MVSNMKKNNLNMSIFHGHCLHDITQTKCINNPMCASLLHTSFVPCDLTVPLYHLKHPSLGFMLPLCYCVKSLESDCESIGHLLLSGTLEMLGLTCGFSIVCMSRFD